MMKTPAIVALEKCNRYHKEKIRQCLYNIFDVFDGLDKLVKKGQKVLLKPNLLSAVSPVEAVTTHPLVMRVLTEFIQQAGGEVYIGDSPGSDRQEDAHRLCGMEEVARETGAQILSFNKITYTKTDNSFWGKPIPLPAELEQIDLIINVAKLKTHSLTGLTGAVKNTYGCVVGKHKKAFHLDHPLPFDFSRLLLDVYLAVKPAFSLIDAVVGMEGAGPRRGRPCHLGFLMGSPNGVALDTVAAEVLGFKAGYIPTIVAARERGLVGASLSDIEVRGASIDDLRVAKFDKGPAASGNLGALAILYPYRWIRDRLYTGRPYPVIDYDICSGCGVCSENCPVQIIKFESAKPMINKHECIRCYCCQELCPEGAINLSGK